MARGSRCPMVRVSLFQFQDIITCVSGILIMITLLLTTMVQEDHAKTVDPSPAAADPARLRELTASNEALQTQLVASADPEFVKAEKAALTERLHLLQPSVDAAKDSRTAQTEALKSSANAVADLEKEKTRLADAVAALEKEVTDKQARLLEDANSWWLVPKIAPNSKLPVLVVVSDKEITVDEFNKPSQRMKFGLANAGAEFGALLKKYNANQHYFVFYVKPSGIANFSSLKELAQAAGFQIGFDAALENVKLNFFKPAP